MSQALDEFRDFLLAKVANVELSKSTGSPPALVVPAKNDETGALTIYDDGDELTVEIGKLHHTHFSGYNYDGETEEARLKSAAEHAASYVADILSDRICFVVHFKDSECIGSTCCELEDQDQWLDAVRSPESWLTVKPTHSERYLWSSRIE